MLLRGLFFPPPPHQHITAEFIQDMYVPVLSPKERRRRGHCYDMVSLLTKDRRCELYITIVLYLIIIIILIYIGSVIIYYKFVSLKRWPKRITKS